MNILTNNKDTLCHLFATFSLQEVFIINQNLAESWEALVMPPEEIISVLKANKIAMESFLSKKCLLLTRFYLSDSEQQKAVFLSKDELCKLFSGLPAVEGFVFKEQISRALEQAKKSNQALLDALAAGNQLANEQPLSAQDPILQLTDYSKNVEKLKVQRLNQLTESEGDFMECFYYLKGGELYVLHDDSEDELDILMYSELSPMQQLTAQRLFSQTEKVLKVN